jgi:hypothetical protein
MGRLIVLQPDILDLLLPAALTGFIVSTLWDELAGLSLLRNKS